VTSPHDASASPSRRHVDRAKRPKTLLASNRKARHDYALSHVVEAGIVLRGSEVKSLRETPPSLQDGYARVEDGEFWLYGVHIAPLAQASYQNHEPRRKRKLLLHTRELRKVETLTLGEGTTIVPLSIYFLGPHVKVELGVGRGKRAYDKRETIRQREMDRDVRRATRR